MVRWLGILVYPESKSWTRAKVLAEGFSLAEERREPLLSVHSSARHAARQTAAQIGWRRKGREKGRSGKNVAHLIVSLEREKPVYRKRKGVGRAPQLGAAWSWVRGGAGLGHGLGSGGGRGQPRRTGIGATGHRRGWGLFME